MELIELIVLLVLWLSGKKKKPEGSDMQRHHRIDPGTDLEGARPKIDRYGLDHAVPVLVYEVGPDAQVQMAKKRAGDKRRLIEQRLEAEEAARDAAQAADRGATLAALQSPGGQDAYNPAATISSGAVSTGAAATAAAATATAAAEAMTADAGTGAPPIKYPYAFQKAARVTHRPEPAAAFKQALVVNTSPISHQAQAGTQMQRRQRQRDSSMDVIKLITEPKSLARVIKAKIILDPPPAFADETHFRS